MAQFSMRDFAIYILEADYETPIAEISRYGCTTYLDELNHCWEDYRRHVKENFNDEVLKDFALSGWYGDLNDPRALRNQPVKSINFRIDNNASIVEIDVDNQEFHSNFRLIYRNIVDYNYSSSEEFEYFDSPIISQMELRFTQGYYQHEYRFFGGSRLVITAEKIQFPDLDQYIKA